MLKCVDFFVFISSCYLVKVSTTTTTTTITIIMIIISIKY